MEHRLNLLNRSSLILTGIVDVIRFDLNEVLLETDNGMLTVKGADLHVSRLSLEKGEVDIGGTIDALSYSDAPSFDKKAGGLFGRIFA
ncbi:MAG: sporulation protein YabP [Lachnospiraceae bacterium]|jgi:sporulation protein YabP|nr:sporulation protein YabP [Lachnospiraceae bacterium]